MKQFLMSPVTGPIAAAVAFALAVGLGVATAGWEAERASYEARIATLSRAASASDAALRTELASCRAIPSERQTIESTQVVQARAGASVAARRLLERQPEGIDACARMESADRAVLSNLKK